MAEKKAKTAQKVKVGAAKQLCPSCGADNRVEYFTGFGKRGYFWVCEKSCGYTRRTR